ncbi:protein OSB1, mitochondrial-like [Rutidosis leptorrhynchoides]|uniref:protein OSB1, mitochondrial-like n=1 Tax=Rutidosis leptorrhynchoides TaxID=125765 RepID=UPI003A991BCA
MAATGDRLRPLLRTLLSQSQLQSRIFFSSSSSSSSSSTNKNGSIIYQHTLKTQRPNTIRPRKHLANSVSFIGTVNSPLKSFTASNGLQSVYTQLKVEYPSNSNKFMTIFLDMWDDMAELSIQHLKPNDYIYVSGYLRSVKKASDSGKLELKHKVIVKEINFVANKNQKTNNMEDQGESSQEKQRNRLYLWQVFFANPYEWQDLRKHKVNPGQPDFKHESSGEALWLKPYDPPWIMKQLRLLDSRMGDMGFQQHPTCHSSLSQFEL